MQWLKCRCDLPVVEGRSRIFRAAKQNIEDRLWVVE